MRKEKATGGKASSLWVDRWKRLKKQKSALVGLGIIVIFILIGALAPVIAPGSAEEVDLQQSLQPPSSDHLFGTDDLGRDVLSRVIYGARVSLWVGFFSVCASVIVGCFLGLIAGYYGGWVDTIISRCFDIILAFPSILLSIAIVTILGLGLTNALIAVAIVGIPTYGRLIRSRVISVSEEEYIASARVIGMSRSRILIKYVLPNSIAPVIVQATLGFGSAIISAASLGFLGLGAQPPTPEWGAMISQSRQYLLTSYWTVLYPGLAIMLTVLGFNMLGDGLRDALDPKMKS